MPAVDMMCNIFSFYARRMLHTDFHVGYINSTPVFVFSLRPLGCGGMRILFTNTSRIRIYYSLMWAASEMPLHEPIACSLNFRVSTNLSTTSDYKVSEISKMSTFPTLQTLAPELWPVSKG